MRKTITTMAGVLAMLSVSRTAGAVTIFFDDFEDGDVSDWTVSSNHDSPTVAATADAAVGNFAMETYFIPGATGSGFNASAIKTFVVSQALTNVSLSFFAKSVPCDTCTISYEGDFNYAGPGAGIAPANFSGTDLTYTANSVAISDLTPGLYRLRLGVYASQAFAGRFSATFDDVRITGTELNPSAVPEPATWATMIAGFGLVGGGLRGRRRRTTAIAVTSGS